MTFGKMQPEQLSPNSSLKENEVQTWKIIFF